ncbi:M24 family metallopeptidase [Mycolicibacter algericus]|uniref:Peptidase n=2 Tax=Mycolicibacter algericus TaxID=1288388 RepID=A0A7I9YCW9_MYCAL|nr:M24 family metallopeptidase [Mycolicibacter algericus]OQZ97379.1 peptidase [Mycolicibacter algericus DSM 45454]GFG86539.1 peptidase [Mycolicibacter algericus]
MGPAAATLPAAVGSVEIADVPDRARLRRETGARLRAAMAERGIDALVLLGNDAVTYATGTSRRLGDAGLSHVDRPVAVVLADDPHPHLFLPFHRGGSENPELPADHLHGPVYLEFDEGVAQFAKQIAELIPAGSAVGVDECTGAMRRAQQHLFPGRRPIDAIQVVADAKLIKTADELSYIRSACRITEQAMAAAQAMLAPGARQLDLSAHFLRRAFELGADASMFEPIWQVMPASRAAGVWTTHGELALPLLATGRELSAGDVLWSQVSISCDGYCSELGRTWIAGSEPTSSQRAQFRRWREIISAMQEVIRAGCNAAELARVATAANAGVRPWLPHGCLGHGIGVTDTEMPKIGTDLGAEFDRNFVFEPGMVLVLEPMVWEDGTGGYRGEEVVVVTDEGFISLTDYPFAPYEH